MRVAFSIIILACVVGGAGALAAWGMQRVPGETDAYRVEAIGPSNILINETVHVEAATVLTSLQAAAAQSGLELDLVEYAGMGTYVRAIGGIRAEGATGWIYEVQREGAWENGDRSAAFYALQKGDAVRWSWLPG